MAPVDPTQLAPGTTLSERYTIQRHVGAGGFADVYRAIDRELDRPVAVKVLNINLFVRDARLYESTVARFMAEGRIAAKISHPHAVKIFDVGRTPFEQPFLVMEFLEGLDLGDELDQFGPVSPRRAISLLLPCIEALGEAHTLPEVVIHKDLKPSNLFLSKRGTRREMMRVVDFGVARLGHDEEAAITRTGHPVGTPQYMAPEYIAGDDPTPALDVYQIALVLVEMLTGERVVSGRNYECYNQHLQGELNIPASIVQSSVGPIIAKSLALNPRDRYEDANALADDLAEVELDELEEALGNRNATPIGRTPTMLSRDDAAVGLADTVSAVAVPPREANIGAAPPGPSTPVVDPVRGPAQGSRAEDSTPRAHAAAPPPKPNSQPNSISTRVLAVISAVLVATVIGVGLGVGWAWNEGLLMAEQPTTPHEEASSSRAKPAEKPSTGDNPSSPATPTNSDETGAEVVAAVDDDGKKDAGADEPEAEETSEAGREGNETDDTERATGGSSKVTFKALPRALARARSLAEANRHEQVLAVLCPECALWKEPEKLPAHLAIEAFRLMARSLAALSQDTEDEEVQEWVLAVLELDPNYDFTDDKNTADPRLVELAEKLKKENEGRLTAVAVTVTSKPSGASVYDRSRSIKLGETPVVLSFTTKTAAARKLRVTRTYYRERIITVGPDEAPTTQVVLKPVSLDPVP